MISVKSPVAGRVFPISEAGDPVFAQEIMGPGVAVEPELAWAVVAAPVAGRLVSLQPHAFALETADGQGILVHLGIDTVKLKGKGFGRIAAEGDEVAVGDGIVEWDPAAIAAGGISATVLVIAVDRPAGSLSDVATGRDAAVGDPLFSV
ncbi:MAG: PTS glucose transporter subunit IIA [Propionibacteriaceae bacterium]|jgi:PTS system N-acetylglucosamine-specific IIA component|nr:PTS glucose transporter subunit IIA [Propionibacteriaceae bacterium]